MALARRGIRGGRSLNNKRVWFFALATAILLALPVAAGAATIIFNSAPANGYGYGVGIYDGTVDGVAASFVCDDFYTDIADNQSWPAMVGNTNSANSGFLFNPSNPADAGAPLPGNINQQQDYNMIGWLANQIFADPTNGSGNWANLSFAIWSLNDANAYTYAQSQGIGSEVNSLIAGAYSYRNTPSNLTVYTPLVGYPNPNASGQEFVSPPPTPEPGTIWLFLSGGLCLAAGRTGRNRKRSK